IKQCVQGPAQEHPNREKNHCLPKVVTFLVFNDFLGMSLAGMTLCFCGITGGVLWVFVKHRGTPIVKANIRAFSYMDTHSEHKELLTVCNKGSITAFY
ncbi:hypothetical protein Celaphus_00009503, partial [Cervus elaphus hippelaphus]